ncbi:MAG: FtsX-like permease family protein, partial [Cyclobacteriaceae bacterium]
PIGDIYLYSEGILDPVQHGDIRFIWLFGGVAAFILIIACINFVNLSTAKSANRAKEVGLRKAIGSNRSNIVAQFLTESLLYSLLSFVLAIGLAWTMLPYFNVLASKSIAFPWNEWSLLPILIGASLVVGLLSGLYPSFYLSSFEPIQVLKGKLSRGSKNAATRNYLVVFQFTTSIILIIATIVIYQQVDFILNKKLGFEKDNVILIHGANSLGNNTKNFKEELLQLSQVKNASIGDYLPIKGTKRNGNLFWNEGKRSIDKEVAGQIWEVDHDYIQTMEMNILEGRDFSKAMSTDSLSVIINQAMARELGLSDPLGKRITNGRIYNVIGVVEDFNYESLRGKIEPLCFVLGEKASIISVKVNSTEVVGTLKSITSLWKKFSPSQSIRYSFLDESYARMYDDVQKMGRIFTAFAVLAIMVASLGLFALSAFMVEQRGKEISIRLVLGATLYSVFSMLAFSFIRLVLVSIVIAIPIAWYSMQRWLEDFTYKTDITLGVFVTASLLAIFIALSTISYQSIRAAL